MFILQVFAFFFPINLSDPFCHNENVIRRNTFTLSSTFNSFGSKANEKENENENVVYARLLCGCVCVCVCVCRGRAEGAKGPFQGCWHSMHVTHCLNFMATL